MEPIFTLPYSEWETIQQVQRYFRKRDGFAVLVPVSRQQKGMDFLILNTKNGKSLRVQVKGSRSYSSTEIPKRSKRELFKYNLWFNNFLGGYVQGEVDLYILFGLYPVYATGRTIKAKKEFWTPVLLAFRDAEMKGLLSQVKTKKEKKTDRFFGISGNDSHTAFGMRGFETKTDLSHHLLDRKVGSLLSELR